ncbi:PAS-domain containing protein [Thalassobaculum sp. OXR-137]|uniref:PAS-domain containing protein n=1 Tax=Thalassobaculum sp. OXR-137 TaxID=3100173 RepID=UPI002AC99347|nr:PAS-domain containing protein [Thalassobaculum sp. OXR-137]WPZ36327.1 PAS-domain containing protein [Thalassobaculum sp. OXR-137]
MTVVGDVETGGGGPAGAAGREAMEFRVLGEQLRFFFGQTRDAVAGHTVLAIAVFLLLINQPVDQTALIVWLGVALSVAASRLLLYRRFPRENLTPEETRRWRRWFEAISFASGGLFGLLPVLFLDPENFQVTAWILLIMSGMAGGALGTLSAYANAFRFYLFASMAPLLLLLLELWYLDANLDLLIIAVLCAIMCGFFLRFSRRFERALVDQIKGRLENVDLADRVARQGAVLQSVLQAIPNAIAVVDPQGRVVYANDRFQTMFDLPDNLLDGTLNHRQFNEFRSERGDFDHLDPAQMEAQIAHWERLSGGGSPFGYERLLPDGRVLRVDNRPMPDGGWVRSWTDVSDERAAERETARWTRMLQLTLDSIDQGLSIVDAEGDQVLANRRYCELLGLPEDYSRRPVPLQQVLDDLEARGELVGLSPELNACIDRWETGEDPSPRLIYERRQPNGNWLLIVANRLPEGGHVRTFTDITSRKLAEISAAERRELLETTLASIDQGVIMRDADDNVLVFNDRLADLLGVPLDLYRENRPSSVVYAHHLAQTEVEIPAELNRRIDDWLARHQSGETVERLEYDRMVPNGRWIHAVFQPLAHGRVIRTFSDITEARRSRQALVEKTEFLETVLAAMEQGVLVADARGRIILWNDRAREILALPVSAMEGQPTIEELREVRRRLGEFDTADPQIAAYVDHWNDWVGSDTSDIFIHEREFRRGNWMLVYGRKLSGGGTVRTLTDITQRKRGEAEAVAAREEAEETRERIRAILQSIPVGVLVYDASMHVAFWNDAYCNFTGIPAEALVDRPHFRDYSRYIYDAHDRRRHMSLDRFMAFRRQVYDSDERFTTEFFFDGTGLDVQYIVASLPDGGRVNVIVDISQQKQAERTALDARDTAEEATRAKSAFLAAMSHEIRTPLNGVIGMAEVLEQTGLDDDQRAITATIRDSGEVLLRIIDDILDFSKIEAGRLDLEVEQIDLRAVCEAVLDTLAPAAEAKDLDLVLQIDPSAPAVFVGDPTRVRQILMNLAGNAVKFTRTGSVAIHASARPDDDLASRMRLRLEIRDTGVGIEADRLDQLFEPFSQAEVSTTRRYGGTGLGLSICRRLVGMMQGLIGVESEPGAGSTFWVDIPVEPAILEARSDVDAIDLSGVPALVAIRPGPLGDQVAALLSDRGMVVSRVGDADAVLPDPGGAAIVDGRLGTDLLRRLIPSGAWGHDVSGHETRALWVASAGAPDMMPIAVLRPVRRAPLLQAVAASVGRAFPEAPKAVPRRDRTTDVAEAPSVEEAAAAGRLILVVEDNATNRMVVERQLGFLRLAAETAVDGVEALRMWREKPYGLVLTDCHMPNMDGYELTAAIREAEKGTGRRVPIVALTANALVGEAERCLAAGMDDYLAKPVTLETMGATLNRWLDAATRPVAGAEADGAADSPIDFGQLRLILGSTDPAFTASMLDLFAESFRSLNAEMRAAIEAGDMGLLRETAHAAKGASANACANRLRAALEALQLAATDGDEGSVARLFGEVESRSAEVFDYLRRTKAPT